MLNEQLTQLPLMKISYRLQAEDQDELWADAGGSFVILMGANPSCNFAALKISEFNISRWA